MINIFVLVTILGHLPVILSAKSKGSENMEQILIVEDASFLNKMLDYNLTADGYGVTSALNARTAADAIRQREFDLVLLDINLPDGNGFELCKLIKPQYPDTIVIFLTANDQESDQIRGYEVGAVDYITKPFVIGALQRKIKAMFAMLEHHKPARDIYDDGRLFLDFSEQTASLNGKPLILSPMEYKMLNLFRKMCIRDRNKNACARIRKIHQIINKHTGNDKLSRHLLQRCQSEISFLNNFNIIIHKADNAKSQCGKGHRNNCRIIFHIKQ